MPDQNDGPLTRAELRLELGNFKADMQEFVRDSQKELKADMQEFVRDAQTEILRAFHIFEQNRELRFARLKAEVSNLDQEASGRMANIEKRLLAIEERLILGPPKQ